MPPGPVVGFDLDKTLIDTAPGHADVLGMLSGELGGEFPLELLLADYLADR